MVGKRDATIELRDPVANGKYRVTLEKITEGKIGNEWGLRFKFSYENNPTGVPNEFVLFDINPDSTPEQRKWFAVRLERICRCFHLEGALEQSNYERWVGKKGIIEIGDGKDGFKEVKRFICD